MMGIPTEYVLYAIVFIVILQSVLSRRKQKTSTKIPVPRDHLQRAEKQLIRSVRYTNRKKYKSYKMDFNGKKIRYGRVRPAYLWNGYWAFEKTVNFMSRILIVKPSECTIDHQSRTVIFKGVDVDSVGKIARLIPCKYISEEEHIIAENEWADFIRSMIVRQANIDTIIDREWLSESAMRPTDHKQRLTNDGMQQTRIVKRQNVEEVDPDAD